MRVQFSGTAVAGCVNSLQVNRFLPLYMSILELVEGATSLAAAGTPCTHYTKQRVHTVSYPTWQREWESRSHRGPSLRGPSLSCSGPTLCSPSSPFPSPVPRPLPVHRVSPPSRSNSPPSTPESLRTPNPYNPPARDLQGPPKGRPTSSPVRPSRPFPTVSHGAARAPRRLSFAVASEIRAGADGVVLPQSPWAHTRADTGAVQGASPWREDDAAIPRPVGSLAEGGTRNETGIARGLTSTQSTTNRKPAH